MIHLHVSPSGHDQNPGTEQAPWQSLHRVAQELKKLWADPSREGDITVHLAPGVHRLRETLKLGPGHGYRGTGRLSFVGSPKEASILSSGYALEGWKTVETPLPDLPSELQGKVWSIDLPSGTQVNTLYGPQGSLPRARGQAIQPQLMGFCNPEEMPPTYGPNGINPQPEWFNNPGNHWIHKGFAFQEGDIQEASDLHEAEFLIIPRNQWTMNILPIHRVDFKEHRVELAQNCTYPIGIPHCAPEGSIWLENSLSVMSPGTWVYHAKESRLYYCPEGDQPEQELEAAGLTEFVLLEGEHDLGGHPEPVENVHFQNLTFRHSNRFAFHGLTGKGIQHDWEMFDAPSSMLRLRHAHHCSVKDCCFEQGGSGGVRLDLACQHNRIENNTFRHLGACGVLLCGYGPSRHFLNRDNAVVGNHIHHIGEHYWHCPGIFIWQSGNNRISENHLHDLPYTAIVCSGRILYDREGIAECSGTIHWDDLEEQCGKGYVYNIWWYSGLTDWWKREPLLHSRENLIEYNHIHDVMKTMGDGNGIYISGAGGGNVVRFNVVGPCPSPTMAEGIRCDDDQHQTILHGNLVYAQGGMATGITLKGINRVTNNILALPLTHPARGLLSLETGPLNGSVIKNNIFLTRSHLEKPISEMRIHGTGRQARLADTDSDHNIYFCIDDPQLSEDRLRDLQSYGTDLRSRVAEPGFEDASAGDFRLKPDASALDLGFISLPLEKMMVGAPAPT